MCVTCITVAGQVLLRILSRIFIVKTWLMISVFRYHVAHCAACIPGATYSFTHIHCEDMAHDISIQVSCGTLCSLYPRCYVFFHAYSLWGQQQQERGDDGSFEGWGCCTKRKSCHALQLTHTGLAQYSTWQYCAVLSHSCSALNVVTVHCHG